MKLIPDEKIYKNKMRLFMAKDGVISVCLYVSRPISSKFAYVCLWSQAAGFGIFDCHPSSQNKIALVPKHKKNWLRWDRVFSLFR